MSVFTTPVTHDTPGQATDFLDATDPFVLFETWFEDAVASEPNDPNAMALATIDDSGLPNVRVVLLKGLDGADRGTDRGFVFYTNFESQKGREILSAGKAAINFHWKSLLRQIRVRGTVAPVDAAEADAYFASRARGSRIGAWASQQSEAMPDRDALKAAVASREAEFEGGDVPRPPHWSGLRLTPQIIEFWHDRPYRLHERLEFRRETPEQDWSRRQLYP
jgi:pyridoxamine 5'-phosphate oxidase